MAEMGLVRRIALCSPHFMSVPHLRRISFRLFLAQSDGAFVHGGQLKLLEPPFEIP